MDAARTAAQEAARESVSDLVLETSGVGTFVLHLPSQELVVDDRLLELVGVDRADFTGRGGDLLARLDEDEATAATTALTRAVVTAGTWSGEYSISGRDGVRRRVAVRGRSVVGQDGNSNGDGNGGTVTAVVGVVEGRESGPAAVGAPGAAGTQAESARTIQILETMSAAFYSLDRDWRFTYVNGPAETLIGFTRQEAVGQVVWDLFPQARGTVIEATYRDALSTGEPAVFEAYYPRPLDAWFEIRVWPRAEGLSVFFLDITARHAAQEAAERSTRRLAALGETALALADAEDIGDVVTVMTRRGLAALDAQGSSIAVPDPTDPAYLLSYITDNLVEDTRSDFARLPVDAQLSVAVTARTGQRMLLGDQAACEAFSPHVVAANVVTGCQAWASLPLRADGAVIGVLTLGWREAQSFDERQLELLETYAAQCAQTLQRLAAREAERAATAQQAALVALARALGEADSEQEVVTVLTERAASLLQADGAVLCLREAGDSHVRVLTTTNAYDQRIRDRLRRLPVDFDLPAVRTAVTGVPFFHTDRAQSLAAVPGAAHSYATGGVEASAAVPLHARGQLLGCLSVTYPHPHPWPQSDRDLLAACATLVAQTLERIGARDAEREAGAEVARFSETLQRSLLSGPTAPADLQVAVRYVPAASQVQVGGDWYDAFVTSEGITSLVIGDVTGHDRHAAAAMAQFRNLLRGIGYALGRPPAAILSVLDQAAHDLGVVEMATVVLAQVHPSPPQQAAGLRTLRWSNAGHLPPLLLAPDGTTCYLDTAPDLLLGLDPATSRADHELLLAPGSTVLFFTDGLVERRGAWLQDGLDWLARAAAEVAHLPPEQICDALLAQVGDRVEDDVALLVLRPDAEESERPR